jgi:hypothetical protein
LLRIHVLKLDELLDVLLRITRLDISKAGLFQVTEGRDRTRTKDV